MRRHNGFTLIEMLLVITLIAAISVASLAMYRQKILNMKISKTALQMQQWLQAGQLYYLTHHDWPTATDTPELLQSYLPINSEKNAFGKGFEIIDREEQHRFRVRTQVPVMREQGQKRIAKQIANLLPNANSTEEGEVFAEVLVPGLAIDEAAKTKLIAVVSRDIVNGVVEPILKPDPDQCSPQTHDAILHLALSQFDFNSVNTNQEGWLLNDLRVSVTENATAWTPQFSAEVYRRQFKSTTAKLIGFILCEPKTAIALKSTPHEQSSSTLPYYF